MNTNEKEKTNLSAPVFSSAVSASPRWLREIVASLGVPEMDGTLTTQRWLWNGGEVGVVASKLTHTWQVVAFGPRRSVTVRASTRLTDRQIRSAVALAELTDIEPRELS